jgi:CYTH domain-containing protein
MGKEIERKFLVRSQDYQAIGTSSLFKQGYLYNGPEKTIRIRIANERGFLTIKGKKTGCVRPEYEYDIPYDEAEQLLEFFCEPGLIEKIRYTVPVQGFTYEVDEFLGANEGLIIAEIELNDEQAEFPKPEWLGEEVTDDPRYLNSHLAVKPYKTW